MRRRLCKLLKIASAIALSIGVLLLAFLCFERARGALSLANYKRQLAARGEAVTPEEFIKPPPQGANGAEEVIQGGRELIKGNVLPEHYPPRMKLTRSGRAVVGFRQAQWTEDKTTYNWDQLAQDLRANKALLEQIRASLKKPVLDNRLDYSQGPKMRFTHLTTAKSLTYWFGSECQLALHENRLPDCLDPLLAEIALPRLLENDRIVISELVRIALAAIARTETWEALQAEGWTDEQLAQIQKAWEEQHFLANFTHSLEGERIFASTAFDFCRRSNEETGSLLFWMEDFMGGSESERPEWEKALRTLPAGEAVAEFLKKQVYCRLWRFAWLDQCERRNLEQAQQLLEISRAAEKGLSSVAVRAQSDALVERTRNANFYDALRFPLGVSSVASLSRAVNNALRAETERSLVLASIALKRYALQHTDPPSSLDLLVPGFLAAVPIDYRDGKPLRYAVKPDRTTLLYSVGEDGIDDHGDSAQPNSAPVSANVWARKDFVWPAPAFPADIEADSPHPATKNK